MLTNKEVLNELQIFATKTAKQITDKPVTVYIAKHVPKRDLNKMLPEFAMGSDKVAMNIVITTVTRDGKTEIYGFYIIVNQEVIDIYKTNKQVVKNILLHELSHIPDLIELKTTGKEHPHHGKTFKETARKLGAPEIFQKKMFKAHEHKL